jgi:hypothetical protein
MGNELPLEHFALCHIIDHPEAMERDASLVLHDRGGDACDNDVLAARGEANLSLVIRRWVLNKLEAEALSSLAVIRVDERLQL